MTANSDAINTCRHFPVFRLCDPLLVHRIFSPVYVFSTAQFTQEEIDILSLPFLPTSAGGAAKVAVFYARRIDIRSWLFEKTL